MTALVVLDIGSTLVDGPDAGPAARMASLLRLGDEDRRRLRHELLTRPWEGPADAAAFLEELGAGADAVQVAETVWAAQEREARPIAGAARTLSALHDAGVELAVASNIWRPYLTSVRRHLGDVLDRCVRPEMQLYSFVEGVAKPSPELLRRALERAGVRPADAVMVGDSYLQDMAPAIELGCRTAWVLSRAEHEAAQLDRVASGAAPAPTHTLASIADLPGAVLGVPHA